jgi:hypothetical protein
MSTQLGLLANVPDPAAIHRRLGEVVREERLLRRLLRLSLAAQEERKRRAADPKGVRLRRP